MIDEKQRKEAEAQFKKEERATEGRGNQSTASGHPSQAR